MARRPTLSRLELRIMETLWTRGACSVREIHAALPDKVRPALTTVQTMVYRLEKKQALRCVKRIGNANIFDAAISRDEAHTRLIDDLLALFDGHAKPVMARLVQSGKLTLEDIREAEEVVKGMRKKGRSR
jgi:BlaI family transcriptional regulator, penicillinase repressor